MMNEREKTTSRQIEEVWSEGQMLAFVVRNGFRADGLKFFTTDEQPMQVASMSHPKGHEIVPHLHKRTLRKVEHTSEVILVKEGKVSLELYDNKKIPIQQLILETGDLVLLLAGGHGFSFLEDSVLVEIKQGPYLGVNDKEKFNRSKPQ